MSRTNQKLNVGYIPPVHDLASCAACGASNKDPKTDIFDLMADRSHFRLCRRCAEEMKKRIDSALKYTDAPGNWRGSLCADILDDAHVTSEQVERAGMLTMTIPDASAYACLSAKYAGGKPEHQPLRPQDKGAVIQPRTPLEIDVMAASCLDFLRHPSRVEYVRTGKSDLDDDFRPADAALLRSAKILVCADIAARGDEYVLAIPGMTLKLAALCAVAAGGTGNAY